MKHSASFYGLLDYICMLIAMVACYLGTAVAAPWLVAGVAAMAAFAVNTRSGLRAFRRNNA